MKKLLLILLLIPSVLFSAQLNSPSTGMGDVSNGVMSTSNFNLEVSKGNVEGHYSVGKFGSSSYIQVTPTDVWDRDQQTWLAPTDARVHQIASSTDNDTATTGTGAWTIRIWGLPDWDTKEVSEDIVLNGTTDVPTDPYVIIHRMKVLTTASVITPAHGLIEATADGDGTVTAQIVAIKGQTQMAIMGVPSTQTFYMYNFGASIAHSSPGPTIDQAGIIMLSSIDVKNNPTVFAFKHTAAIQDNGLTSMDRLFNPPKIFKGPTIIKLSMVAGAENSFCDASFDGILVDNGY
jgi:hypothetical protein